MTKAEQNLKEDQGVENLIPDEVKKQAEAAVPNSNTELQAEVDKLKDALMRTMAEAENTRKRAAKEIDEANKYGVSSFAKDLILVLENLTRAAETLPPEHVEGIELTRKELLNVFERRAIKRIEPKPGEKFDHNFHQAVAQLEDAKFEPGSVIQVVQSGYIIHDRLLRPAMVTVSKGAPQPVRVDTTA